MNGFPDPYSSFAQGLTQGRQTSMLARQQQMEADKLEYMKLQNELQQKREEKNRRLKVRQDRLSHLTQFPELYAQELDSIFEEFGLPSIDATGREKELQSELDAITKYEKANPQDKEGAENMLKSVYRKYGKKTVEQRMPDVGGDDRSYTATAMANMIAQAKYGKLYNELDQKKSQDVLDSMVEFEGEKAAKRAEEGTVAKHVAQIKVITEKGLVPKALPAGEIVSLSTFENLDDQIKDVIDTAKANPSFIGPVKGSYKQLKIKFVDDPEFADFNAKIGRMIETAYALSGKQISQQELKMLENRFFATAREPYGNFLAKMNSFQKWLANKRKTRIRDYNNSGYYVPLDEDNRFVRETETLEQTEAPTEQPTRKFKILSVKPKGE